MIEEKYAMRSLKWELQLDAGLFFRKSTKN